MVPLRVTTRQAHSGQVVVARNMGGNPSQHAAVTSETMMTGQLKASGTLGQTGRAKINHTTVIATQTTMASIPGFGTLDTARA